MVLIVVEYIQMKIDEYSQPSCIYHNKQLPVLHFYATIKKEKTNMKLSKSKHSQNLSIFL